MMRCDYCEETLKHESEIGEIIGISVTCKKCSERMEHNHLAHHYFLEMMHEFEKAECSDLQMEVTILVENYLFDKK